MKLLYACVAGYKFSKLNYIRKEYTLQWILINNIFIKIFLNNEY